MNALVRKEFRLILPLWSAVCSVLMVAQLTFGTFYGSRELVFLPYCLGLLVLGLTPFGREFSSGSFSSLLAQPSAREKLWRAKVHPLALASLTLFCLFVFFWMNRPSAAGGPPAPSVLWFASCTGLAVVTGGLWTTLLFRQVTAAFWITLLIPAALALGVSLVTEWLTLRLVNVLPAAVTNSECVVTATVNTVFVSYSIAGYWWARRLFLRAQDVGWGVVEAPVPGFAGWFRTRSRSGGETRHRPLRTLLAKEFQLHSLSLFFAVGTMVLHLAAIGVRKFGSESGGWREAAYLIWALWFILPFVVGAEAVASERQFGTMEGQLCLPARRRTQFILKLLYTLAASAILGGVMPWLLENFASLYNVGSDMLTKSYTDYSVWTHSSIPVLFLWSAIAAGVALLSFFASTLTRGTLQAMGGAVVIWILVWLLILFGARPEVLFGAQLWRGKLFYWIGGATLLPVVIALCYWNFRRLHQPGQLWRRNLAVLVVWLAFTIAATTATYHRSWEFAMRLDPPAGPPRLSGPVRPVLTTTTASARTFVLLPDGRLWSYKEHELVPIADAGTQTHPAEPGFVPVKVIKMRHSEFIGGSNWIGLAPLFGELFLIQSEGSLWNATWWESVDAEGHAEPAHFYNWDQKGRRKRPTELKVRQFGADLDWMAIASGYAHFIALKRNGTIWGWGGNVGKQLGEGPMAITNAPLQMGADSDWVAVFAASIRSFALKRDGSLWRWGNYARDARDTSVESGPLKVDFKVPGVRAITSGGSFDLILDTEGHLWGLGRIPQGYFGQTMARDISTTPVHLGAQVWSAVSPFDWRIAGLKRDGTLWAQGDDDCFPTHAKSLKRIGQRSDWIAVLADWQTTSVLAKDGTLCRFGEPDRIGGELLAPTRRPLWTLNILDAAK